MLVKSGKVVHSGRQKNQCPLLASEIMGLSVSLSILGHSNIGMIIFKG